MPININELSLTVPGNVVKNNDKNGNSILRMDQEQALSIKNDLDAHFDRNPEPRAKPQVQTASSTPPTDARGPNSDG